MIDPVVNDIVATAADFWKHDRPAYFQARDQWAEQIFFRLRPEGCIATVQSCLKRLNRPWDEDVEKQYRDLKTLHLARSTLFGLVLSVLPQGSRGGSVATFSAT